MGLAIFLARRIAGMLAVLFVVSILVFSLLALSPGSVVATLLGNQPSTPEAVAAIKSQYHLDDPFFAQYWHWLSDAVHGDFGRSIQSGETVTSMIAARLPVTLELAVYALVLVVIVGIPVGMAAGIRSRRLLDRSASALTVIGMSAPVFVVGIVLIYIFGVQLSWLPVYGAGGSDLLERAKYLTLPAITLAISLGAVIVRQTRAAVLNVMDQDYVVFARARGLSWARIMVTYALRNSALPIITAAGLLFIVAISAAVIIETVFSIPGVGSLMVQSITAKDVPVVQGLAFFVALLVVLINLLVDTASLVIDPRTRVSVKGAGR